MKSKKFEKGQNFKIIKLKNLIDKITIVRKCK